MNTTATLTRPPPAPRDGRRPPADLFATPPEREQRYRDVLNRLARLEADYCELAQRVADWTVKVEENQVRVRTFNARLEALERAVETACPCKRDLNDAREDLNDLERGQLRLWAGLDLTREQAGFEQIPDELGTVEPYDPRPILGMAPTEEARHG